MPALNVLLHLSGGSFSGGDSAVASAHRNDEKAVHMSVFRGAKDFEKSLAFVANNCDTARFY
jgi:hypothetical protein